MKEMVSTDARPNRVKEIEKRISKKEVTVYDIIDSEEEEMNLKRMFLNRSESMEMEENKNPRKITQL